MRGRHGDVAAASRRSFEPLRKRGGVGVRRQCSAALRSRPRARRALAIDERRFGERVPAGACIACHVLRMHPIMSAVSAALLSADTTACMERRGGLRAKGCPGRPPCLPLCNGSAFRRRCSRQRRPSLSQPTRPSRLLSLSAASRLCTAPESHKGTRILLLSMTPSYAQHQDSCAHLLALQLPEHPFRGKRGVERRIQQPCPARQCLLQQKSWDSGELASYFPTRPSPPQLCVFHAPRTSYIAT